MLSKRTNPMIGRLSELLVFGNRAAGILDVATSPSPRSPLELRIQTPTRGLKNYDIGGVGLGIVVALENSSTIDDCNGGRTGHEILAKYAICSFNNVKSDPVPVRNGLGIGIHEEILEMDSLEDYTYVTSHGPDNKSFTKVYYDHGRKGNDRIDFNTRTDNGSGVISTFKELPAPARLFSDEVTYPTSQFLSYCNLCKKKLHGRDIYIYRGEKAFCSMECRSRQMMIDERKERCRSEVQRSAEVSSSPYTSPIFSTGILAI